MTIDRGLLDKIRSRGEEVLTQLSGELMANPRFMKAMEGAVKGGRVEQAAAGPQADERPDAHELKRASRGSRRWSAR